MILVVLSLLLTVLTPSAVPTVGIVVDGQLTPPARYGIAKLERALTDKGLAVVRLRTGEPSRADFYVLAGQGKGAPQSLTIHWFDRTANEISSELALAEKAMGAKAGNEFLATACDLKILAGLARYYAARLPAAVAYNIYKESGATEAFDEAIAGEKRAVEAWRGIVAAGGDVYNDRLPFGARAVGFRQHWKDELALLEKDFAALEAERVKVEAKSALKCTPRDPDLKPPVVSLEPPTAAEPGRDLWITVEVTGPEGVKWVRLRYRHVTQLEHYQTAGMVRDPRTGLYSAAIAAAFIDPKWDLMYFVEAVGTNGAGRMYPDLEREIPYVVVPAKR